MQELRGSEQLLQDTWVWGSGGWDLWVPGPWGGGGWDSDSWLLGGKGLDLDTGIWIPGH
jgi:hypothetical protein